MAFLGYSIAHGGATGSVIRYRQSLFCFGTFLSGMIIWYGLGFVRIRDEYIRNILQISIELFIFCTVSLISYYLWASVLNRRKGRTPSYLVVDEILHVRVFAALLIMISVYMVGRGMGGMMSYHSLRILQASGIIAGVMMFVSSGILKKLYAFCFISIALLALLAYSRRPFLTVVSAPVILYVQHYASTRKGKSKRVFVPLLLGALASSMALVFVTGLRVAEWDGSAGQAVFIFSRGVDLISAGSGFDTIRLFDYVISSYPDQFSYLNGKSLVGAFANPVPRELWSDKPIAFGVELATRFYGVDQSMIPVNFGPGIVAEAYANGGTLAVLLAALIVGYFLAKCDTSFMVSSGRINSQVLSVITPPVVFFLVRGDFLNSFYEFYAKALPCLAVLYVCIRKEKVLAPAQVIGRYKL